MKMKGVNENKIPQHVNALLSDMWDDGDMSDLGMGSSELSVNGSSTWSADDENDTTVVETTSMSEDIHEVSERLVRENPAYFREKKIPFSFKKMGILPPMRPNRISSVSSIKEDAIAQTCIPPLLGKSSEHSSSSFLEEGASSNSLLKSIDCSNASKCHYPASLRPDGTDKMSTRFSFKKMGILPPNRPTRLLSVEDRNKASSISFKKLGILPPTRPLRLASVEPEKNCIQKSNNFIGENDQSKLFSSHLGILPPKRPARIVSIGEKRTMIGKTA